MATPSDTPLSESDLHTMMHLESMRKEMSSGFHQQLGLVLNKIWEKIYATAGKNFEGTFSKFDGIWEKYPKIYRF